LTVRIYELAKELGRKAKDLVETARSLGFDVKTHMTVLDELQAARLREAVSGPKGAAQEEPKPKKVVKKATKAGTPSAISRVWGPGVGGPPKPKAVVKAPVLRSEVPSLLRRVAKEKKAPKKIARKPVVEEVVAPEKTVVAEKTVVTAQSAVVEKPAVRKPAKKKVPPTKVEEKPEVPVKMPPVEVKPPKELPPSEKPLTIRKKKPGRAAKILYRPGDEGGPPLRHAKKKRPTPQPLARIPLDQQDEDVRGIKFRGKGLSRDREERKWTGVEDLRGEVPARPRVPFRRPVKRGLPVARPVKVVAKPTQAELVSPVSIKDFSSALGIKANVIITKLMQMGVMANINQALADDVVGLLADELSVKVTLKKPKDIVEDLMAQRKVEDKPEDLEPRAPVVTFLGHVDHGKTSLLDAIRKANVVSTESGGITQHIGAYKVSSPQRGGAPKPDGLGVGTPDPRLGSPGVVFLDTPGHEAFTEMRARGANVTDVAVLVVAADDGVMPQTEEAINHAREAKVPIVVAINKMDLPQANADRVRQQLGSLGLIWDGWGGNTVMVECSALTKHGLDELVEMLSLEAELLELKANPRRLAEGTVIEARSSEGRGVTATILVRKGTLHVGDVILCGRAYGHVRAMYDDKLAELREAGPSTPVSVTGLSVVPEAGDRMYVVETLAQAKEVAQERERKMRSESLRPLRGVKLEEFFDYMSRSKLKELRVIIKADVKGSLEVLRKTVPDVATSEVRVRVIHAAVGGINESDVLLAAASDAIIIGFHVAPEEKARLLAEEKGVDIRLYQVIYQMTDEVKKAVEGLLAPEKKEVVDGHVEVREIFKVSRLGTVAGCYVTDGAVTRQNRLRVVRDGAVIYDGRIESLKRFKDDVREVRAGFECGIKIAGYDDIKVGDQLVSYHVEEIARKLE
jgi:translation initiation factor IF-2